MHTMIVCLIALLSLLAVRSEWATQPSEMHEASAQASRPYRVKVTSPHPFVKQIGAPFLGEKKVITPVPKGASSSSA